MAQLPLPEILSTYLSRRDTKALLFVSRSACPENPLSLQEQLLVMTRRANALRLQLVSVRDLALTDRFDYPNLLNDDPVRLPPPNYDLPCAVCGRHGDTWHHRMLPDGDIMCESCVIADPTKPRGRSCRYIYAVNPVLNSYS